MIFSIDLVHGKQGRSIFIMVADSDEHLMQTKIFSSPVGSN